MIGRAYHHTVRLLFRLRVRDTDCDFRLIRRDLLDRVELTSTSGVICVEMMRRFQDAGATFAEVGVSHHDRPHGRSQFFRLPAHRPLGPPARRAVVDAGRPRRRADRAAAAAAAVAFCAVAVPSAHR